MKRQAFALLSCLAVVPSGSARASRPELADADDPRDPCRSRPAPAPTSCRGWSSTSSRIQLGQQIVVENRGGAGGTIGTAVVAKADPDGYTILGQSTSHAIAPAIYPNMTYDVARDFAAVAPFGRMPTALVMAPSKGIKTIQQFVTAAKAKPRIVHLRLGRRRLDHASDRRAVPVERRLRGGPRAVQGRRFPSRGRVGPRRFRFLADRGCGA